MKNKLTPADLASVLKASYGNGDDRDLLLKFILAECADASACENTMQQLGSAVQLLEAVKRDVHTALNNLDTYTSTVLTAQYVEWFVASGRPASAFIECIGSWRQFHVRNPVDDAFGHMIVRQIKVLTLDMPDSTPEEQPRLVLQKLRDRLIIASEFLPEGGNPDPIYAVTIEKPATDVRDGPRPADGQAVPEPSVPAPAATVP